jgi:hypothetical protein
MLSKYVAAKVNIISTLASILTQETAMIPKR